MWKDRREYKICWIKKNTYSIDYLIPLLLIIFSTCYDYKIPGCYLHSQFFLYQKWFYSLREDFNKSLNHCSKIMLQECYFSFIPSANNSKTHVIDPSSHILIFFKYSNSLHSPLPVFVALSLPCLITRCLLWVQCLH